MTIRWGLVGASTIAREWVLPAMRATHAHEPIAVYSRSVEWGHRYAEEEKLAASYSRLDDLLDRSDIDAVYVSTTNDRHADHIVAAANAGKHVLAEKPLALTLHDAHAAVAACKRAGVVLATNHHFRNNLAIRRARTALANGEIGRPLAVRIAQAFMLPEHLRGWRLQETDPGAGVLLDLAVHDIDTLRFVLTDEVQEVFAFSAAHVFGAPGAEDAALGVIRFRSGVLASFLDAFTTPGGTASLEIHGTDGSIVIENALDERLTATMCIRRRDESRTVDVTGADDLYSFGLRRFADAVWGNGRPAADGHDGLQSLAAALALRRSAAERRAITVESSVS